MDTRALPETLPEDSKSLKKLLHTTGELLNKTVEKLNNKEREYSILEEKYKLLKHALYAMNSVFVVILTTIQCFIYILRTEFMLLCSGNCYGVERVKKKHPLMYQINFYYLMKQNWE